MPTDAEKIATNSVASAVSLVTSAERINSAASMKSSQP